MPIISFGGMNKSLLYIVLMSTFMVINQYIYGFVYIGCFYQINIYQTLYNAIIDKNKNKFPFHRVFDPLFGYIGVIILSFFIPKEEKDEEENIKENTHELTLIYNDTKDFYENQNCVFIFLKLIILWIAEENLLVIFVDVFQDLDFSFFELIYISYIFSRNFFFKIYPHQKLGMSLSIGVGSFTKAYNIIMSIKSAQEEKDKTFYQEYPWLCFFSLFYQLLILTRSYVNTQLKILMDLKFVPVRSLFICYGLIGLCMCSIIGIFTSFTPCFNFINNYVCKIDYEQKMYFDHFINYFESWKNMGIRLIIIILGSLTFFFTKYYNILIINYYTPIHTIFSYSIKFFIEKTFLLIFTPIFFPDQFFPKKNQFKKFLLDQSVDVTSIIGLLIYLEMIELNFCGLNYNLEKNIINRGKDEYRKSVTINSKIREERLSSITSVDTKIDV